MGVQSLLKSCLQILSMCHCKLVWFCCLELSAAEYTQRVQTAKQQGQLQAVICSSAQQLAKGRCQKGNSFSHLPHLCQSLGEATDSSVSYGQTSLHPRASFPIPPHFVFLWQKWAGHRPRTLPSGHEEFSCWWL